MINFLRQPCIGFVQANPLVAEDCPECGEQLTDGHCECGYIAPDEEWIKHCDDLFHSLKDEGEL